MASVLSHPAAAIGLAPWWLPSAGGRLLAVGAACAVIPDADAVGFWLGVPYGSVFGHRGLTHSFAFAAVLAAAGTATFFRGAPSRSRVFAFLFLCGASHGILDAMTDGGLGVALLAPFDDRRIFFPWRPIRVSPIGVDGFFGARGLAILESEVAWIWLPCAVLALAGFLAKRRPAAAGGTSA